MIQKALKFARRVVIVVAGTTILLLGIAMIVLPGPALVMIPAGLAILAVEFTWARHWLRIVRDKAGKALSDRQQQGESKSASRRERA